MTKKILTLLSVFCGAAIVGTTFAAWAVTDNADPFGIKVTPGKSGEDETKFVTLSYGSTFSTSNLENLTAGTLRMGAAVGLAVDTAGDNYEGKFTIELKDLTDPSEKQEGDAKLIDNLIVKLYSKANAGEIEFDGTTRNVTTDLSEKTPDGTVPLTGDTKYKLSQKYTVSPSEESIVYVVVDLVANLSPAVLDQINSDWVRIEMNWDKGSDDDKLASPIYLQGEKGKDYYCYAWTADGKKNAEWPGVAMVEDTDEDLGVYSYTLGNQYTYVIFHENGASYKTGDLELNDTIRTTTPCWKIDSTEAKGSWIAKPIPSGLTADYYLVGSFTDPEWTVKDNTYGMTKVTDGHYKYENIEFKSGDELKVRDQAGKNYYSSVDYLGNNVAAEINSSGNIEFTADAKYNVNFYTSGTNGNYVILEEIYSFYMVGNRDYSANPCTTGESWNDFTKAKVMTASAAPAENQVEIVDYTFDANAQFRIKSNSVTTIWGQFDMSGDESNPSAFSKGEITIDGDNAKVVTAGTYTIYYHTDTNQVWVTPKKAA